ncbi:hypothetical protein [Erythrobacter phage vB_EliS-L02]|nr:hypothetical protein [Erythrobacter phage vB_EliS-L02]
MTITLGYWLVPLVITILAFIPAFRFTPARGDYAAFGNAIGAMLYAGGGAIVTLLAWLVYFAVLYSLTGP